MLKQLVLMAALVVMSATSARSIEAQAYTFAPFPQYTWSACDEGRSCQTAQFFISTNEVLYPSVSGALTPYRQVRLQWTSSWQSPGWFYDCSLGCAWKTSLTSSDIGQTFDDFYHTGLSSVGWPCVTTALNPSPQQLVAAGFGATCGPGVTPTFGNWTYDWITPNVDWTPTFVSVRLTYQGDPVARTLNLVLAPEPSTCALAAVGLAALGLIVRRGRIRAVNRA